MLGYRCAISLAARAILPVGSFSLTITSGRRKLSWDGENNACDRGGGNMPSYVFTPDPHASNQARVQDWIDELLALPNVKAFLATPANKSILLSDNHNSTSISAGNRATIAAHLPPVANVQQIAGFSQKVGARLIWVNPTHPQKKPIKVLIHEIGHMNWPGIGANVALHDAVFYRLLNDALIALGLTVNNTTDLNNTDISHVVSPAGNDPLGYRA